MTHYTLLVRGSFITLSFCFAYLYVRHRPGMGEFRKDRDTAEMGSEWRLCVSERRHGGMEVRRCYR